MLQLYISLGLVFDVLRLDLGKKKTKKTKKTTWLGWGKDHRSAYFLWSPQILLENVHWSPYKNTRFCLHKCGPVLAATNTAHELAFKILSGVSLQMLKKRWWALVRNIQWFHTWSPITWNSTTSSSTSLLPTWDDNHVNIMPCCFVPMPIWYIAYDTYTLVCITETFTVDTISWRLGCSNRRREKERGVALLDWCCHPWTCHILCQKHSFILITF